MRLPCFDRQAVDWPDLLSRGQRFSVAATLRDCATIPSTQLIKTRVKDAICDAIRDARCAVGFAPLSPPCCSCQLLMGRWQSLVIQVFCRQSKLGGAKFESDARPCGGGTTPFRQWCNQNNRSPSPAFEEQHSSHLALPSDS